MKQKNRLLVLLIGACSLMLSCSRGWQVNINGTANGWDFAWTVTVDGKGDVVAAGFTNNGTEDDFFVVKFDGVTGAELWRQVINGTANSSDQALAVTVDSAGDVVAAGTITNAGTKPDFAVVKFNGASGSEVWRQVIRGTVNGYGVARAVTVDSDRNVIAAGATTNIGIFYDFTVIKFNGTSGDEIWRQVIKSSYGAGAALAIAVDGVGNVVAAGGTRNIGPGGDFTVVKLDGKSGGELWRQVIKGTATNGEDVALAAVVDGAGNVVAAGYTTNTGTQDDFFVVKFDGVTGAELWRQVINGTANSRDQALSVAVDGIGNVIAAGFTANTATAGDFTVVKFDGVSGAELWRRVINGTANEAGHASGLAVDASGNVVAAGVTRSTLTYHPQRPSADFTVVKFDGVSGAELWRRVINGTTNGVDVAFAVTVDSAGDVVAAGRTANTGTGDADFTVVKLRGIDGSNF